MTETRHIHIAGAGMAGLSAALQLSLMGEKVTVYEAAPYAGGRCRSYYDRELDCRIDNGNHLVLSGNVALQDYLFLTRANESMTGPNAPLFPFMDLETGERWTLLMNSGRLPWWIFDRKRRVPGTKAKDYFSSLRLLTAGTQDTVASRFKTRATIYRRLWEPLAVSILNTEPESASAQLLRNVLAQTAGAEGKACIPMMPKIGMSESYVMPCLNTLRQHGAEVKFGQRLRRLITDATVVKGLDFGGAPVEIAPHDWVILAVPPWVARGLVPGLTTPEDYRSIINVHYRVEAPPNPAGFTGIVGGLAEWIFVKPGVVSVTISAAERYEEQQQETWALYVWRNIAKLYDLDPQRIPPWRVVHEKRATIAATPQQNALRPRAYIDWKNLALAGDWTNTGLPCTIESAIRSGIKAAQVVLRWV